MARQWLIAATAILSLSAISWLNPPARARQFHPPHHEAFQR
jgi:hypothetical protein